MKLKFIRSAMVAGAFLIASVAHGSPIIEQLFLADLTGNFAAQVNVDESGNVVCSAVSGFTDACGTLTFPAVATPHGALHVEGTVGQFGVDVASKGGVATVLPAFQNLTQQNIRNMGSAGDFETEFTDTRYCIDFPSCFGSTFRLAVGQTPDFQINGSHTGFDAFVSSVNSIPATDAINPASIVLTGNSQNGSAGQIFANPNGASGSLSSSTLTHFTGMGTVQTTFTISTTTLNPEPSTFALFGLAAGFLGVKLWRRKV